MTGAEIIARLLLVSIVAIVVVSIVSAGISALRAGLRNRSRGR